MAHANLDPKSLSTQATAVRAFEAGALLRWADIVFNLHRKSVWALTLTLKGRPSQKT